MSFEKPTLLQIAVHEAGHAYAFASLLERETPKAMGVSMDREGYGRGWNARRTVLLREVEFAEMSAEGKRHMIWMAEVETAIAIAGPLAEFRHRLRNREAAATAASSLAEFALKEGAFDFEGDFARIRCSLSHVSEKAPLSTLLAMILVADVILATNWSNVRKLSRMLLHHGRLDEGQIDAWFAEHPARNYDHRLRFSDCGS